MNLVQRMDFERHNLPGGHVLLAGELPVPLLPDARGFERLWELHPADFHDIRMHGRLVKTPRWQQAYGMDYVYAGGTNWAQPIPELLKPLLDWARRSIASNLNGLLVNWYDGARGHYIGRHRDSPQNRVEGSAIVTISFGEKRTFRLRPWRASAPILDFPADNGTVFVMPWETNLAFTHEVPRFRAEQGKRVSVTMRAFQTPAV